jgi:hypothetical protein
MGEPRLLLGDMGHDPEHIGKFDLGCCGKITHKHPILSKGAVYPLEAECCVAKPFPREPPSMKAKTFGLATAALTTSS